ncbi:MAG: histidine phosphatase family protein [Pirellulaceae bacterium]
MNDDVSPNFPLTLLLMRHAKSDWSDGSVSDHGRSLNKRGQRDTPRMAQWILQQDLLPDCVLSSSSMRTTETVELLMDSWADGSPDGEIHTSFNESLYLASPETIFQAIVSEGGSASRLLVVAHNPGMSQLASAMANQSIEMPTAAIAVFGVGAPNWDSFDSDTALQLTHLIRPKSIS